LSAANENSLGAAQAEIDVRRRSFDAGDTRHRDTAGTFQTGDQVEYRAEVGSDWLLATVIGVSKEGCIRIDLLPGVWLRQEDQATRVRPGKPKPSSAGNPTPKAGNIMNSLLNDNNGWMASSLGLDSPRRKRGPPSPPSFCQSVESTSGKRRAACPSPDETACPSPGPAINRNIGPGQSPIPVRQSKDDLPHLLGEIRKRSSLKPPEEKHLGMSRSPSCPSQEKRMGMSRSPSCPRHDKHMGTSRSPSCPRQEKHAGMSRSPSVPGHVTRMVGRHIVAGTGYRL